MQAVCTHLHVRRPAHAVVAPCSARLFKHLTPVGFMSGSHDVFLLQREQFYRRCSGTEAAAAVCGRGGLLPTSLSFLSLFSVALSFLARAHSAAASFPRNNVIPHSSRCHYWVAVAMASLSWKNSSPIKLRACACGWGSLQLLNLTFIRLPLKRAILQVGKQGHRFPAAAAALSRNATHHRQHTGANVQKEPRKI